MLNRMLQSNQKLSEKTVLELYLKNQGINSHHLPFLEKALQKHLNEKHKLDNNTKLEKYFDLLNMSITEAARKVPSEEVFRKIMNTFVGELKPKLEKKLLAEIDSVMGAFTNYFKNVRLSLDRSPINEGFLPTDIDYCWGDKDSERCSYDRASEIRSALIGKYEEVINLDFSKFPGKNSKHPILKVWDTKHSPILLANLNHLNLIDAFLKQNILPIKKNSLYKLGHEFGLPKLVNKLYKGFIRLLLKMVVSV